VKKLYRTEPQYKVLYIM